MLPDLFGEIHRQDTTAAERLSDALRVRHAGEVHVYFSDYVSYGIGGGDATAEYYFGCFLMLHKAGPPEEISLYRPSGTETVLMDEVLQGPPLVPAAL
ncbi:MAG: hypothetical protein ACREC5_07220 [Thermoplasmata archaeon]